MHGGWSVGDPALRAVDRRPGLVDEQIQLGARIPIDAGFLDVLRHADHRVPRIDARPDRRAQIRAHALPDRIAPLPQPVGQGFIDDDDPASRCRVGGVEPATSHDRDPHRHEVVRHHELVIVDDRDGAAVCVLRPGVVSLGQSLEGQIGHGGGGLHARHPAKVVEQSLKHEGASASFRAGSRQRHRKRDHPRSIEAGVDAREIVDGAHEQPGADREHHRQRNFRGHERTADAMAAGGAAVAMALLQDVHEIGESVVYGGRHSKQHARRDRHDQRKQQHGQIDRQLARSRQTGRIGELRACAGRHARTHKPIAPPATDNKAPSVIVCWIRRPRLAPSAARRANSRRRDSARASPRLARFAHAITRTSPAADCSSQIDASRVAENRILQRLQPQRVILWTRRMRSRRVPLRFRERVHQGTGDAGALAPVLEERGELGSAACGVTPSFSRPMTCRT